MTEIWAMLIVDTVIRMKITWILKCTENLTDSLFLKYTTLFVYFVFFSDFDHEVRTSILCIYYEMTH